jgi:hypothetical protein
LRARLHRHDALTSALSNARTRYPHVSRADFSGVDQALCGAICEGRDRGDPRQANSRGRVRSQPGCIPLPMARPRQRPFQDFGQPSARLSKEWRLSGSRAGRASTRSLRADRSGSVRRAQAEWFATRNVASVLPASTVVVT